MYGVQDRVPRPPTGNDTPISLRLPDAWLKRADALIEFLSEARPGMAVTRSDALRVALARGLEVLEAERDAASRTPSKPRKR
jgi:hypothetical protein